MIILSFLGLAKDKDGNITGYKPTVYQWDGKSKETTVFGEALLEWFPDSPLYVVVTNEVKTKSPDYQKLKAIAGDRLYSIDIPLGKNESEMWDIFDFISQQIPEGDVVFDFTHGFRSSPIISLLALAYLQSLNKNDVKHLLYGAFEARSNNITPVFDLKPMFQLLEWANAANFFTQTGNAKDLAGLIKKKYKSPLNYASDAMTNLSAGLIMVRPNQINKNAKKLVEALGQIDPELIGSEKPFKYIIEQIGSAFSTLDNVSTLERELAQIEWYENHRHYVQAFMLAREWIISLVVAIMEEHPEFIKDIKEDSDSNEGDGGQRTLAKDWLYSVKNSSYDWLYIPFDEITQVRNNLAHCGYSHDQTKIATIVDKAESLPGQLKKMLSSARNMNLIGSQ